MVTQNSAHPFSKFIGPRNPSCARLCPIYLAPFGALTSCLWGAVMVKLRVTWVDSLDAVFEMNSTFNSHLCASKCCASFRPHGKPLKFIPGPPFPLPYLGTQKEHSTPSDNGCFLLMLDVYPPSMFSKDHSHETGTSHICFIARCLTAPITVFYI